MKGISVVAIDPSRVRLAKGVYLLAESLVVSVNPSDASLVDNSHRLDELLAVSTLDHYVLLSPHVGTQAIPIYIIHNKNILNTYLTFIDQ